MTRTFYAAGRSSPTLGERDGLVYVTRRATLQYQALRRLPFEEARRELTLLLLHAEQDPRNERNYLFRDFDTRRLLAYVVRDGALLLVGSVTLADDAPGAYGSASAHSTRDTA